MNNKSQEAASMRYFILGGTGFIGRHLVTQLIDKGHGVIALVRSTRKPLPDALDSVDIVQGDPLAPGSWQDRLRDSNADVVVNLVGNPIIQRWTPELKKVIHDTRILSTRMAVQALEGAKRTAFFCANAVGYYDDRGDETIGDDAPAGNDFLAGICRAWQQEAEDAQTSGHRVIIGRFAPVIGKGGGLLAPMLPVFKAGLGGVLGNGNQWMSWIHVHDLCRAIVFSVEHASMSGPLNMTSPQPVTNKRFTSTLGRVLHRPTLMRVPAFALKMAYGQASEALLDSQRCVPTRLGGAGFGFRFQDIRSALEDACS
ncbi:TIGR01777 family oxidoreductase [Desulfoplanes sp.]